MDIDGGDVRFKEVLKAVADDTTRGTESGGIDPFPTEGRLFVATDSDAVYVGDGDSWLDVDEAVGLDRFLPVPEDLTARDGGRDGEVAVHDGSGAPARAVAEWRGGDGDWYSYAEGSLFGSLA